MSVGLRLEVEKVIVFETLGSGGGGGAMVTRLVEDGNVGVVAPIGVVVKLPVMMILVIDEVN